MPAPRILIVGSANMDLLLQIPRVPGPGESALGTGVCRAPGGKGANAAAACARMGAQAVFAGKVGCDGEGDALLQSLRGLGVDTGHVLRAQGEATGLAVIPVEADGQNRILVFPGANATLGCADIAGALEDGPYDAVVMQLEIPLETVRHVLTWAREKGVLSLLDAGPAMRLDVGSLGPIDVLSPNESETQALCGIWPGDEEAARRAAQALMAGGNVGAVLLKLGERGAYLYREGHGHMIAPFRVDAVDPTAAGDAFGAAFVCAKVSGKNWDEAVRIGNAAGALTATRHGAQPALPTAAQVYALAAR
nr:ribokinase [bacterium]